METAFSALSEEKFLNNGSMLASSLLSAKSNSKEMALISILLSDRMCAFYGELLFYQRVMLLSRAFLVFIPLTALFK